jgi:hypothetical protein
MDDPEISGSIPGKAFSIESNPEVKRHGREADHSPQYSPEVKIVELYLHSTIRLDGALLS